MRKPINISINGFSFDCATNYTYIIGIDDRCLEQHLRFLDQIQ